MNLKQIVFRGLSELYAFQGGEPKPGLRILMYHAIGTDLSYLGPKGNLFSLSLEQFKEQMLFLEQKSSLKVVQLASLPKDLESDRFVAITFDDGYADNLTAAAPVLRAYRFPFTVFAVPGFIQSKRPGYLTVDQLKELAKIPDCRIGSHGMNHLHLARLDDKSLKSELEDSRKWLENVLAQSVQTLAYPYGSVDRRVRDAAAAAGYTSAVCSRVALNVDDQDPMLLCRTAILSEDDPRMFELKLSGGWDWYKWR